MIAIFKKYKWESTSKTGGLSYKTLRTKIIPEIISTYLKIDTDLSPCFSNEKVCNQFIHTNVNNYDLHLLKSKAKRIYNYKPFIVYPQGSFEELHQMNLKKNYSNVIVKIHQIKLLNGLLIMII